MWWVSFWGVPLRGFWSIWGNKKGYPPPPPPPNFLGNAHIDVWVEILVYAAAHVLQVVLLTSTCLLAFVWLTYADI